MTPECSYRCAHLDMERRIVTRFRLKSRFKL